MMRADSLPRGCLPKVHGAPTQALRRCRPARGQKLTMANIRGPWHPSGAVAGAGVFAVRWQTHAGSFWAALHDFHDADQRLLIAQCQQLDADTCSPAAHMAGGTW